MIKKYRKKPVVIEAVQFLGSMNGIMADTNLGEVEMGWLVLR